MAAQWAGMETVAFCEIDPFCQRVLHKHWPEVPIFPDIRLLTKEVLERAGISGIDIVAGGYPCQPYSLTGERRGEEDDRALWSYMFDIVSELRSPWVVGENVIGHVSLGLDSVLSDLESIGYTAQPFIIPACSVGARHQRYRVFTVAHNDSQRMERGIKQQILWQPDISVRQISKSFQDAERRFDSHKSRLCRSLHGIPGGVDRVRSLGNTVMPQQIYPVLAAITEIERLLDCS
ncbi:DNA-cytosine methyltransferase [Sporomusa ovata]|uniref:DNA (cytosine-5-)-methyltransferase n=1 Tax=Sporomusa ovata TaxID=2378 RepID=A0A0U1L372_9FIRM|nr:DNA-cytosine methyltransferase [Sporomusa ovata]